MDKIYFFQPNKNNWDLQTIEKGYLVKLHSAGSLAWQFGDSIIAEIMDVDFQQMTAKVKLLEPKIPSNWSEKPKSEKYFIKNEQNIYELPFRYFIAVTEKEC